MQRRGIFMTFEGPEGSGKSTHSRLLCSFLRKRGFNVLYTREPGGTAISERIRKVLLDPKNKDMDVTCEMLLYMAARAQIVSEKILPALKKGKIVICDRFLDATLVYQGYAGGTDVDVIRRLGKIVTKGRLPDLTFLLDIDSKKGLLRSGKYKDRMEKKSLSFHKRVRRAYLTIARREPKRVKIFSAIGDTSETQERIRKTVLKLLGKL